MKTSNQKRTSKKSRIELATFEIMCGYLFLNEAIEKYEVSARAIIRELKKSQRQKNKECQKNQS